MSYPYRQPRPGGCCASHCTPPLPPKYQLCEPEPLPCCDNVEPCCSHCQLSFALAIFPDVGNDPALAFQMCVALHVAEKFVGRIVCPEQRRLAMAYAARHIVSVNGLGQVDQTNRLNAIAGGKIYNPPKYDTDFWLLSSYGAFVNEMFKNVPVVGVMAV